MYFTFVFFLLLMLVHIDVLPTRTDVGIDKIITLLDTQVAPRHPAFIGVFSRRLAVCDPLGDLCFVIVRLNQVQVIIWGRHPVQVGRVRAVNAPIC